MSKNSQFEKFINPKKGSVIKEEKKQEKRAYKKQRAAAIDKRFDEKRKQKDELRETGGISRKSEAPVRGKSGGKTTGRTSGRAAADTRPETSSKATISPKPGAPARSGAPSKTGVTYKTGTSDKTGTIEKAGPKGKTGLTGKFVELGNNAPAKAGAPSKTSPGKPASGKPASGKPMEDSQLRLMPLNKYIAHSGVCSRRDAADVVKQGDVQVNGEVVKEPGYKVADSDVITVKGKKVTPSKDYIYILLNKPKDYITTSEDPEGRRTVMELIRQATKERVYPIGRLDRNTSGVLLFTNDGDLAQLLSHPKHEIKKIYEVKLDKPLTKGDFDKILKGITLEDGFIAPDVLAYADSKDKSVIGIEIHSGRNRIVRRIFEHMKYDVRGLDRVMYAGLTKKNVQRGNWRLLNEREVRTLKHFNKKDKSK